MERLNQEDMNKIARTAETYARVFAGPEWNEVSRCPIKDKFYGPKFPPGSTGPCKDCNKVTLDEAYPVESTSKYILGEISSKNAVAYVYNQDDRILAFGWGFVLSGSEFALKKYGTEENQNTIKQLVGPSQIYFMISEVGVIPEIQGKNIGGQVTRMVAQKGIELGLPLLLRTSKTSTMRYTAINMGMKPTMGGKDMPIDPENSKRLLFIKI